MGGKQSLLTEKDLDDYQLLTFLTRQEILQVLKRFCQLANVRQRKADVFEGRLTKRQAMSINELYLNPFREEIIEVFSSQDDHSLTFEDFLDMISVFSENAPKSVKVTYAFKIYQAISQERRPDGTNGTANVIDLYDIKEIVRRLSGEKFSDEDLKKIAEAVISEVDLRDDKKITAEIFEYFLSNVPDFPASFVIPLNDGSSNKSVIKPTRQHPSNHE